MKYSITYSGFLAGKPISGSAEVESISITGCIQGFLRKMFNKDVDMRKITVQQRCLIRARLLEARLRYNKNIKAQR